MLATRFNELLSTALRKKEDKRKKSKTDDGSPKKRWPPEPPNRNPTRLEWTRRTEQRSVGKGNRGPCFREKQFSPE